MMRKHDVSECFPFWERLSESSQRQLRGSMIFRSYKPGENIIFKTVKKDGIIFVLEGRLRVYLASGSGRELTLFNLLRGEAFSIMTVDHALENDVIPALQAGEYTVLAYLQRCDIAPVAYAEPLLADFIFDSCASTAQHILNNVSFCFFNSLRSCVARELLDKSRLMASDPDNVIITHEEIANSLGTTRVVISRELDYLRGMGLITTGRGRIHITDRGGLEALGGG